MEAYQGDRTPVPKGSGLLRASVRRPPYGKRVPRAKALKVRVPDRPGILGEVASALGANGINLVAVHGYSEKGQGLLCLVVDKLAAAVKVLKGRGLDPQEDDILEVQLADRPGTMGEVAKTLGDAGINIKYVFVGTARGRKVTVYLAVEDLAGAVKTLRG